ncbi:MAG: LamG-like jellyroll fold domain-containing protein, partial [Verrucomicrobiota bacterium]
MDSVTHTGRIFDFDGAHRFGRPNSNSRRFVGEMDELALWNTALTATEVEDQFEAELVLVSITHSDSVAAGTCSKSTVITRTWTATDAAQNQSQCVQTVTELDITPPVVVAPDDVTVECTESMAPADTGEASASDACQGGGGYASTVTAQSPLLYWRFNDAVGQGPAAEVDPGSHNSATIEDVTQNVSGGLTDTGGFPGFDDGNKNLDFVASTYSAVLSLTPVLPTTGPSVMGSGAGSVSFWFKSPAIPANNKEQVLYLGNRENAGNGFGNEDELHVSLGGRYGSQSHEVFLDGAIVLFIEGGGSGDFGSDVRIGTISEYDDDEWHHVVVTWDQVADEVAIYVDGGAANGGETVTDDHTAKTFTFDGRHGFGRASASKRAYDGEMDELAIWDTALTLEQAEDQYDSAMSVMAVTHSDSYTAGTCPTSYDIIREWSATDDCGNVGLAYQTITVEDTTAPTFTYSPPNVTIGCDDDSSPTATGEATASDGCTDPFTEYKDFLVTQEPLLYWRFEDLAGQGPVAEYDPNGDNSAVIEDVTQNVGGGLTDTGGFPGFSDLNKNLDFVASTYSAVLSLTPVLPTVGPSVMGSSAGSVSFWFKSPNVPANNKEQVLYLGNREDAGNGFGNEDELHISLGGKYGAQSHEVFPDGAIVLFIEGGGSGDFGSDVRIGTISEYDDNEWHHVVVTWDKTADEVAIYVDGGAANGGETITDDHTAKSFTFDGRHSFGRASASKRAYDGDMDELALWDSALTEEQAAAQYLKGAGVLGVTYSDSIAAGSCAENSVITRTWEATDLCGNVAQYVQTITIEDTTAPTFDCPTDRTVTCGDSIHPDDTGSPDNVADNCDQNLASPTYSDSASGSCPSAHTITRTWTVVDDCGNSANCIQTITVNAVGGRAALVKQDRTEQRDADPMTTVIDDTPPVFVGAVPAHHVIDCSGLHPTMAHSVPAAPTLTATDNRDADVAVAYTEIDTGCPGVLVRTWTATDDSGNTTELLQCIVKKRACVEGLPFWKNGDNYPDAWASPLGPVEGLQLRLPNDADATHTPEEA